MYHIRCRRELIGAFYEVVGISISILQMQKLDTEEIVITTVIVDVLTGETRYLSLYNVMKIPMLTGQGYAN